MEPSEEAARERGAPRRYQRLAAVLALAAAGALIWQYFRFEGSLVRGPVEFAYWPMPLEPLPYAPMRGFTYEQLARHLARLQLLGPALVLLSIGLALFGLVRPLGERALRRLTVASCAACLALVAFVMIGLLHGRIIVDDEIAYRLQAGFLSQGKLADADVPPFQGGAFQTWTAAGMTGKYLFGEPLVQVPGFWLGIPALMHLPLAALALFVWFRLVAAQAGRSVACWSTILLAVSPMFILTSAVGLTHTASLCCAVLAGYGLYRIRNGSPWSGALLAANAIGFWAAIRLQVAAPAGLVISALAIWALLRERQLGALAAFAGVGSAWLALVMAYNYALSGSPFTLPWALYTPVEHYGFGYVWEHEGYQHSIAKAFQNLGVSLVRFNGWWLGWPLSIAPIAVWLIWDRRLMGAGLWLAIGAAVTLMNFAYYSPGISETGPIYYFLWLLPAAFVGGHAISYACRRWGGVAVTVVVVHLALGTTTFLVENVARVNRVATLINEPAERVLADLEPPALLFYELAAEESLHVGWVFVGFPKLPRLDSDPVVVYPRSYPAAFDALRRRYADRNCYYTRISPETKNREIYLCENAGRLLFRDYFDFDGPPLFYMSTAARLGLIRPLESLANRVLARLKPEEIENVRAGAYQELARKKMLASTLELWERNRGAFAGTPEPAASATASEE